MKKIVIVGAGFAGLNAAKSLSTINGVEILLIDRRNHHLFQPLLYQVAMAGLSPADIAVPIRSIFSNQKNVRTILAEVTSVQRAQKSISTNVGDFNYDYLILACGAEDNYFGNSEWPTHAVGLKSIEQAIEIRREILSAFEAAENSNDQALLNFVIIGGGPTGVELAGALSELCQHTLPEDFRKTDPGKSKIILVDAGERLLSSFSNSLSLKAAADLGQMGVQIKLKTKVTAIDESGVHIKTDQGEEFISSRSVIWAAGVKPSKLGTFLDTALDKSGRVITNKDLSLPNDPNVFVLGDQCHFENDLGETLPGMAPVAIQQGKAMLQIISADLKKTTRPQFKYLDKGQMATIGRKKAVVQSGPIQFSGFIAWIAWLVIHIYYLVGFRNRFFVLLSWAWSYITFGRGARLIVNSTRKLEK